MRSSASRCRSVPDGSEVAYFALGCFWGAEKLFWKTPGVTNTAVGYAGGFTPNPTLRGGLQRADRAHRDRQGQLRPGQGQLRAAAQDLLREPRPDPGHAAGQRRRHPVPLGDLHHHARAAGDGDGGPRRVPDRVQPRRATARSPPRSSPRRTSSTPRTTTSSTSTRTRSATAPSTPRASPATRSSCRQAPSVGNRAPPSGGGASRTAASSSAERTSTSAG